MGLATVSDAGVFDLVERANVARAGGLRDPDTAMAERVCTQVFGAEERLAVYGALAPGEARHYMLAPFRGAWTTGFVRGRMGTTRFGLPVLELDTDGDRHPVHILHAAPLAGAWKSLALFEGSGFTRLLAAIENADGVAAIANIYARLPQS